MSVVDICSTVGAKASPGSRLAVSVTLVRSERIDSSIGALASNSTTMSDRPERDPLAIRFRLLRDLIAFSSGVVTSFSTNSGEAPGQSTRTCATGMARSGAPSLIIEV